MIAKIIFGMSTKNSIYYNEEKVKNGMAVALGSVNSPFPANSKQNKVNLLEHYSQKNTKVQNNSTHIILSFTEADDMPNADLTLIARDYLNELGYGKQPAFFYKHTDTQNPHIHIVTTPILTNGQKISHQYIFLKSNEIRKKLEIKYNLKIAENSQISNLENIGSVLTKQKLQSVIKNALDYKFGSFVDFVNYLSINNIKVIKKEIQNKNGIGLLYQLNNKKVIKASNFYFKPTFENVSKHIDSAFIEKEKQKIIQEHQFRNLINYFITNKIEILKYGKNYFLKNNITKTIIDSAQTGIDAIHFENFGQNKSNNPVFKKQINILISRFYQEYKKKNDIYFESKLIENFPKETLIQYMIFHQKMDVSLAIKFVEDFYNFKLSQLDEIKAKENGFFQHQTNKIIYFIEKLNLNKSDKVKLLTQFNIAFIEESNLIFHPKDFSNSFIGKLNFSNNSVKSLISEQLSKESLKLLKQLAVQENPNSIFIDAKLVEMEILVLLNKQNLILKNESQYSVNEHYKSLLNLKNIEFENGQVLNQNHKNYTKALRGF